MADKYATCRQTMRGSGHASFSVLKNFRRAGHTCHTQITELLDFFKEKSIMSSNRWGHDSFPLELHFLPLSDLHRQYKHDM